MNKKIALLSMAIIAAAQPTDSWGMKWVGNLFSFGGINSQDLGSNFIENNENILKDNKNQLSEKLTNWFFEDLLKRKRVFVKEDDISKFRKLFKKLSPENNPDIVKNLKEKINLPLFILEAIEFRRPSIAYNFFKNKQLLEATIKPKKLASILLRDALEEALKKDSCDLIKLLIKLKAKIEKQDLSELLRKREAKPWYYAIHDGKYFPENCNDKVKEPSQKTSLLAIVKLLVKKGVDITSKIDDKSPLIWAAEQKIPIAEYFITQLDQADHKKFLEQVTEVISTEQISAGDKINLLRTALLTKKNITPTELDKILSKNSKFREEYGSYFFTSYYPSNLAKAAYVMANTDWKLLHPQTALKDNEKIVSQKISPVEWQKQQQLQKVAQKMKLVVSPTDFRLAAKKNVTKVVKIPAKECGTPSAIFIKPDVKIDFMKK